MDRKIRKTFLVFGQPDIRKDEINEVIDTLKSGWISTGPKVKRFEHDFAKFKGKKDAVALSSCTAALFLSLLSAGVGHGDEVITTAFTFVATVNAIIQVGAKPVLVDIDSNTLNIDPAKIERVISEHTKAIIPVHFAGRPCQMDSILKIAKKNNLVVIEDASHAIESEYKGQKIGAIGNYGCFSFYATKNLTTAEGGMLICKDESKINNIRIQSLHGLSADAYARYNDSDFKHYTSLMLGYKFNMTDIQASLGIHQLKRLQESWKKREYIWNYYMNSLKDLNIILPPQIERNTKHAYHLFTIQINKKKIGISREEFILRMKNKNIGCGVHYLSIADHPYFQKELKINPSDYPITNKVSKEIVSIPLSSKLNEKDVLDVINSIKEIMHENA